jgi:transposase-like protein
VRWYLRSKLSLPDLVEMMAERGLSMVHTTIMRWAQHYIPEFEKRWHRHALAVGRSWRVDETCLKIKGVWHYLYRAVDRAGRTADFRLSARRDVAAAKAFFHKAIRSQQHPPHTITLDGYVASHRAVRELRADGCLPTETKLRSSKYLNNLIEQDHRGVKQRVAVMQGFKQFRNAAITIVARQSGCKEATRVPSSLSRGSVGHRGGDADHRQLADTLGAQRIRCHRRFVECRVRIAAAGIRRPRRYGSFSVNKPDRALPPSM